MPAKRLMPMLVKHVLRRSKGIKVEKLADMADGQKKKRQSKAVQNWLMQTTSLIVSALPRVYISPK